MALDVVKISDNRFRFTGSRELYSEIYKHVTVDGEIYSRVKRELVVCDYDKLFSDGEFTLREFDFLGTAIKFYNYIDSDFEYYNRQCITSLEGNILIATAKQYDIDGRWCRGSRCGRLIEIEESIKQNRFSYPTYIIENSSHGCAFWCNLKFSDILSKSLQGYFNNEFKHIFEKRPTYAKLFAPVNNDFEMTDRMIYYSELRTQLIETAQKTQQYIW